MGLGRLVQGSSARRPAGLGVSPSGEIQHPIQRNGYAKDDPRVLVESDLGVAAEALFPREHPPEAALSDSARKAARVPTEANRPP